MPALVPFILFIDLNDTYFFLVRERPVCFWTRGCHVTKHISHLMNDVGIRFVNGGDVYLRSTPEKLWPWTSSFSSGY